MLCKIALLYILNWSPTSAQEACPNDQAGPEQDQAMLQTKGRVTKHLAVEQPAKGQKSRAKAGLRRRAVWLAKMRQWPEPTSEGNTTCEGDAFSWNAGYGGCETYFNMNNMYCSGDCVGNGPDGLCGSQVCPACGCDGDGPQPPSEGPGGSGAMPAPPLPDNWMDGPGSGAPPLPDNWMDGPDSGMDGEAPGSSWTNTPMPGSWEQPMPMGPTGGPTGPCQGDAFSWNAGYGGCSSYFDFNFPFCSMDWASDLYASDVCPGCNQCDGTGPEAAAPMEDSWGTAWTTPPPPEFSGPCTDGSPAWDAGYGPCSTYAPTGMNHAWCNYDWDGTNYAYQACSQCGLCGGGEGAGGEGPGGEGPGGVTDGDEPGNVTASTVGPNVTTE